MSDVVGSAAITVTPDFSQFKAQLAAALGPAMRAGAKEVDAAVDAITADMIKIPKVAKNAADDAAEALSGIASSLGSDDVVISAAQMSSAYSAFGDSAADASARAAAAVSSVTGANDEVAISAARTSAGVVSGMDNIAESTGQVVGGADMAASSVSRFGSDAVKSFDQASMGAENLNQQLESTVSTMQKIGIASAVVGAVAIKQVTNLAQVGIEYNTLLQKTGAAFKTLLGSKEAADEMMAKLTEFGRSSPFPRQVFIEATQELLGFGVEAEKIIPIFGAIQDAVAATGGSAQDIRLFSNVFASIQSEGKATLQTLYRLSSAGIDAVTMFAEQTGVSVDAMKKMISAGAISADEATDMLTKGLTEKYAGSAAAVKETWLGSLDRVKGAWRDLGSALIAPFIDPNGGGFAVDWANKFADLLRVIQKAISGPLTAAITKFIEPINKFVMETDFVGMFEGEKLDKLMETFKGFAPVLAAAGAALAAFSAKSIPFIGQYLPAINPVLAAIVGLIAASPELREAFMDVVKALRPLFETLMPLIGMIVNLLAGVVADVIKELLPVFEEIIPLVAELAKTFGVMLALSILALWDAFKPLLPVLADAARKIFPALLGVIPPITAAFVRLAPIIVDLVKSGVGFLAEKVAELTPYLVDLVEIVADHLVPILGFLAAAFIAVKIVSFASSLVGLVTTITSLLNPFTLVIGVIALVAAGLLWLYNNNETFQKGFKRCGGGSRRTSPASGSPLSMPSRQVGNGSLTTCGP